MCPDANRKVEIENGIDILRIRIRRATLHAAILEKIMECDPKKLAQPILNYFKLRVTIRKKICQIPLWNTPNFNIRFMHCYGILTKVV